MEEFVSRKLLCYLNKLSDITREMFMILGLDFFCNKEKKTAKGVYKHCSTQ